MGTAEASPMQRVILGRTGLDVCRLGFGGIPIQRVSEADAVATIRRALERGIDFIDTSRAYTTSERRIGLALKEVGVVTGSPAASEVARHGAAAGGTGGDGGGAAIGRVDPSAARRVILASKSHAKKADIMRTHLETSLTELQVDYIDIYKAHFVANQEDYQTVISPGGALEALRKARDEGLVGHIGITSHSLDVLYRALDDGFFDVIMVCFSFLESQAQQTIIPKARNKNIGVLAMKPFSGGVIEDARLALKYVLAEPGVVVLAGVEHPDLVDENWRAFEEATREDGLALSEEEMQGIADLRQTYDKVFCRRCDYCQPCTENIPIQTILGARALVKRMGKDLLQKGPMWPGIEKARNCSECGVCLPRCPYELPIPDLIRENLAWLDGLD